MIMKEELIIIPKSEYERLKKVNRVLRKCVCDITLQTMGITSQMNKDYEDYKKEFDL